MDGYNRFYQKSRCQNYIGYFNQTENEQRFLINFFVKDFKKHLTNQLMGFKDMDNLAVMLQFLYFELIELEEHENFEMCTLYRDAGDHLINLMVDEELD